MAAIQRAVGVVLTFTLFSFVSHVAASRGGRDSFAESKNFKVTTTSKRMCMPSKLTFNFNLERGKWKVNIALPPGYVLQGDLPKRPDTKCAMKHKAIPKCEFVENKLGLDPPTCNDNLLEIDEIEVSQESRVHPIAFAINVISPEENPEDKDNKFVMKWEKVGGEHSSGSHTVKGWPIYGDWECIMSEWSPWGVCSAQCGGGTQYSFREVFLEPPEGSGHEKCPGETELQKVQRCNEHPCHFPCKSIQDIVEPCTAECGGGVKVIRQQWEGDICPGADDSTAVRLEPCNTEPCRPKCVKDDKWTPVTECSAACGQGTFWMVKQVLQKETSDTKCEADWQEQMCIKQPCANFLVGIPDISKVAHPAKEIRIQILFRVPKRTVPIGMRPPMVGLRAPVNFEFKDEGNKECVIYAHDMYPSFDSCKISEDNFVHLTFRTPLQLLDGEDEAGMYQFQIDVLNAPCMDTNFVPDSTGARHVCRVPSESNVWEISFDDYTRRPEDMRAVFTEGYPLFKPQPEDAEDALKAWRDRQADKDEHDYGILDSFEADTDKRPTFCSTRFPCKEGDCTAGVCKR